MDRKKRIVFLCNRKLIPLVDKDLTVAPFMLAKYWPVMYEQACDICVVVTSEYREGNGTPLQYSCLENPTDRGAWKAAVLGSLRVGHDWVTSLSLFTFMHWRRKGQPTPVFLPEESQGWGSLVGCCLWGRTELDTTEVT